MLQSIWEDPDSCSCAQKADAEKIEEFLTRHVPNALLIGTTNIHCKELRDDLQAICDHILEHNPQASVQLSANTTLRALNGHDLTVRCFVLHLFHLQIHRSLDGRAIRQSVCRPATSGLVQSPSLAATLHSAEAPAQTAFDIYT